MSTGIQWTDETWNCVVGCTKVSQGCKHCYAKTLHDQRHKAFLAGKKIAPQYAEPFESVQLMPDRLEKPLSWRKPKRIFVNSVSDLFHEDVPDSFLDKVFAVMALADRHQFQVLTKRPERMRDYIRSKLRDQRDRHTAMLSQALSDVALANGLPWPLCPTWPPRNVWLGVSVENQAAADERIPLLLDTPAAIRFLSCEPLLEPLDLVNPLNRMEFSHDTGTEAIYKPLLNWVIVGGESGTRVRPCDVSWIRAIVSDCADNAVPCFVKQMGKWITGDHTAGDRTGFDASFVVNRWLLDDGRVFVPPIIGANAKVKPANAIAFGTGDTHGGNWIEWPRDLRVREFPAEVSP